MKPATALAPAPAPALGPAGASLGIRLLNPLLFQLAWFAGVLGAARQHPLAGTACVLLVIGWHLGVSARPVREAQLVAAVSLMGFAIETLRVLQGDVAYPSGQPYGQLAPYWVVALWGLFAISLNVSLRWLRRRPYLAALLGAVAGPLSFASGVRLGGASFSDAPPAWLELAVVWAVLMPLLMWLSVRFDGVSPDHA